MGKHSLKAYIPVIAIIDYDGYWIYSMETYTNINGEETQEMLWKSKKPYAYDSNGLVYLFTLDDYVKVFDTVNNNFYEGKREKITGSFQPIKLFMTKSYLNRSEKEPLLNP